jgi:hypothetical protein
MADEKGMRLSDFKTDLKAEEEGVWVPYGGGFEVKLGRIGNRRFKEFMMKKGKPHMRKLSSGSMDLDIADTLMRDAIAETILLDWKGLLDDDGKPIPFSKEEAKKALAIEDFYKEIFAMAQERELFSLKDDEAAQGN